VDSLCAIKLQKNRIHHSGIGVSVRDLIFQEFEISINDISFNTSYNTYMSNIKMSERPLQDTSPLESLGSKH
jgi:hypothetical protein